MPVPYHEALLSPRAPSNGKWAPYSNAGDFGANTVIIVIGLFCALLVALAISAAARVLLCSRRRLRRQPPAASADPEKPAAAATALADAAPTLVFSSGTNLAGAAAECAICLTEFAEGDGVRVLPACGHGFHVQCVERWLVARSSCPTCRASCLASAAAPPEKTAQEEL